MKLTRILAVTLCTVLAFCTFPSLDAQIAFRPAQDCALCHSNAPSATAMRDHQGNPIAPFNLWHSSPMANAGRDLFWQAVVSAEKATFPEHTAEIDTTCTRCHTPIAWWQQHAQTELPEESRLDPATANSEGISCTVCHQIPDSDLGHPDTFSGHYHLSNLSAAFGPHPSPFTRPMLMHTGITPTHTVHMLRSALCASCHTLFTEPLDAPHDTGMLAEQSPFLEWQLSAYANPGAAAKSCQDCHMPKLGEDKTPLETRIARNPMGLDFPPITKRRPFGKHILAGANTIVPTLGTALNPDVTNEEWAWRKNLSQFMLKNHTADLQLSCERLPDGAIAIDVTVINKTGHKFPTAHPSRRAWIELTITGDNNLPFFSSGQTDSHGAIVDINQQPLPSESADGPIQPHAQLITRSDQVQIYQSIMADSRQCPTFRLLAGRTYLKDNRITPAGWNKQQAEEQGLASHGCDTDPDFSPGADTVHYLIPPPPGPHTDMTVHVRLRYQNLSHRFAAELFALDTPEITTLKPALNLSIPTETVATASMEIASPPPTSP